MVRIFPRVGADSLSARAAMFWLRNNVWRRVGGGVPDAPCGFMFAALTPRRCNLSFTTSRIYSKNSFGSFSYKKRSRQG